MRRRWRIYFACCLLAVMLGLASREAAACFKAVHSYRFVLGSARGGIVVLELDWRRDEGESGSEKTGKPLMWRGPARVGLLVDGRHELREVRDLGTHAAPVARDDNVPFQEPLRAALRAARAYPGFKTVGLPRYHACNFGRWCAGVTLDADKSGVVLTVGRGRNTNKVPLAVPPNVFDGGRGRSDRDAELSAVRLMSILSYDVAGREVLVVDLGDGDVEHSSAADAFWPPCGCRDIAACPPAAPTMHHGSQFVAVVPLSTPFPSSTEGLPPSATGSPAPNSVADIQRAEHHREAALRHDGVYVGAPTCSAQAGWSRHVLRFRPDGKVLQAHGNVTVEEAHRLLDNDARGIPPQGRLARVGNHLTAKLNFDSPGEPGWPLDLLISGEHLRGRLGSPDGPTDQVLLRFVPTTWAPKRLEE